MANPLSKELGIGPLKLPLWGWAIAGVGGVLVARKITGGFGAPAATGAADPNAAANGLFGGGYAGGFLAGSAGGAIGVPGGAGDPGTASTITDNNAWRIAAVNALITSGYDALLASSAIQHYLDGVQLTPQEASAVQWAVQRLGPPPEVVPPPLQTPPPSGGGTKPPPPSGGGTSPVQQSTPYKAKPALNANHLPGETFVDWANSPQKGTWWLTNWGGVYAIGGAPYLGSMIQYRVSKAIGAPPNGQTAISITPSGNGYVIADNWPTTGSYAFA